MILKESESQGEANNMTRLLVKELRRINQMKEKSFDKEHQELQQV